MSEPMTNVNVTKDRVNYIENATGTLYDDPRKPNTYIIVHGGTRPHPLEKNQRYEINAIIDDKPSIFWFYCTFTGQQAEFRLAIEEAATAGEYQSVED